MVRERVDVVIVGAGGGGAILGLALARKGIEPLVLEQASGPPVGLRAEILQPNGQLVMDRLGLLEALPKDTIRAVRYFHFRRAGGERLCTIDYGMLPPPYNRALVSMPNAAHHVILRAFESTAPGRLRYGTRFKQLLWERGRVIGVEADSGGAAMAVSAKLVVGADGARSSVREALGIPARLHHYREAYLIALLDGVGEISEAHYFMGRRTILGVFPAASGKVFVLYMIPADGMPQVKAAGLQALRDRWRRIAPDLSAVFEKLVDWDQTGYLPTTRVRATRWVADGAVLIGDAAHAMNPHASQGRMQAMLDAVTLAEVIAGCLEREDFSASALAAFERIRRPQVDMLQRLADEQVLFWNTGNPLLGYLRDRVFRTLDWNRRLQYRVLATTAGLRRKAPFGLADRLIAAGLLPDPYADHLPPDAVARA